MKEADRILLILGRKSRDYNAGVNACMLTYEMRLKASEDFQRGYNDCLNLLRDNSGGFSSATPPVNSLNLAVGNAAKATDLPPAERAAGPSARPL